MVKARRQQLKRILKLRKQQARMVELEQQRVDALMHRHRASIDELRRAINQPPPELAPHEFLAARSTWLQHASNQIAHLQLALDALKQERAEITRRRRKLERQAEAMSGYVAEQDKLFKQQQQRTDQARLCDFIAQQTSGGAEH